VQAMMKLNESIYQNREITSKFFENIFEIMQNAKKILVVKNSLIACAPQDLAWKAWWNYMQESLKFVQARGHEKDITWLAQQLAQIDHALNSVNLCINLMQHFNGMMVTDYDLLVLGNLVVALVIMQC
jgi:hypothetical protein